MNSKERVLCAVNLEQSDRVPMDFGANKGTLARLNQQLKISNYRELLERLHVDIVDLRGVVDPIYQGPIPWETVENGVKENYWGMRTRSMQTATGIEESYCDFIFQNASRLEDLEDHMWPEADWFDFSGFHEKLIPWSDFAVMASGASVFQHATFLRSMDNLLTDMLICTEMADYFIDRFTDFYIKYFDRMFSAAKHRIDIFRIADDLGMQDRLLISPNLFERFIVPRLQLLTDMAHSHSIKVMFHSCGNIVPFIPRLIDIGIDILDPLQIRAKDMDPVFLKSNFGHKICLHGSIDTQYILPKGTPIEVSDEVMRMINILGKEGGFILSPSHVLQTDVPIENILALYNTGFAKSQY